MVDRKPSVAVPGALGASSEGLATSWTLIEHAAGGSAVARAEFCRRYLPVVRTYLDRRWRGSPAERHLEDAVQEVFLRCLCEGGLLEKADPHRGPGFQGFLYGLTRNVARELEARDARSAVLSGPTSPEEEEILADEEALTRLFDRAYARAVVQEAAGLMEARAQAGGSRARRRVQLLRLRFEEGLPIRDIAARWQEDVARLHREYKRARGEFERALLDTAAEHVPGCSPPDLRAYCEGLLELLG